MMTPILLTFVMNNYLKCLDKIAGTIKFQPQAEILLY